MSNPTLLRLNLSEAYYESTDVPLLNEIVLDTVSGSYRLGDGVNIFANLRAPTTGNKQVVPCSGFTIVELISGITIITSSSTLASIAIELPPTSIDNTQVCLTTSQAITSLTWHPQTGTTIIGTPASLGLGGTVAYVFDMATNTWYPII